MDMLSQAIASRLPFVAIKTDDLINVHEVLQAIAGVEPKPLQIEGPLGDFKFPSDGEVFYTSNEGLVNPMFYVLAKNAKKCVVFVNTKSSVLPFNGGAMFPPKDLMFSYLASLVKDEKGANSGMVNDLLPTFGGMTLKDMFEVCKITKKRVGKITAKGINETRQGYISKLKGIVQVDTGMSYYDCPTQLKDWVTMNRKFFMGPVSPLLIPRGLLFDGPPGTGKTAASKYIAMEFGVPLYRLDIGGMKGKYVGTSEENLNAALTQIDQVEPCVAILDEIEKVFGETHDQGTTSSMLSSLLWWLQEHKTKVFTVMTTNAKGKIPKELYREGRVDECMNFTGLDSPDKAFVFAQNVFASTASTVWKQKMVMSASIQEEMKAKIKALMSNGHVAQSKITQEVNALVKAMITTGVQS